MTTILALVIILAGLTAFAIKRGRCVMCVIVPISIGASILMGSFVHHTINKPMTGVKIGGITRALEG